MKFLQPTLLGLAAAGSTFASTMLVGMYGALLLAVGLFLWLAFIAAIVRAVKPE